MSTNIANLKPIGLILPFRRGKNGYFEQTYDTLTQIKTNLMNWFSTRQGERPLNPLFGTRLFSQIMEQDSDTLQLSINQIIQTELSNIFPTISLVSTNILLSDENIYNISITVQETVSTEFINFQIAYTTF